ncbi:MAG: permease [Rhodospirillales bacterium]|nr:permease [Rhodospirillales bacterium]MCB9995880.1 permease [Rhodospirillales bacterium]
MRNPFKKDRMIGKARQKRQYDLPLNKSSGTGFLILLICLMTFLAMLALAASFALSAMTERWSSGLENKVTVEIPAEKPDGTIYAPENIKSQTARAYEVLSTHPSVVSAHVMTDEEIRDLVRPWLGEDLPLGKVPLPGLISVELNDSTLKTVKILETKLQDINEKARIDTHEEWLSHLLRFTGALQFAAALLTVIIGITTVTAVAGGVRSRMAVHNAEVELLHLMGASDNYISRQFQRHSLIMAFQGALGGIGIGGIALMTIGWISGEMGVSLLPDFTLGAVQIAMLAALPVLVALIATLTARQTVLKVLAQMP